MRAPERGIRIAVPPIVSGEIVAAAHEQLARNRLFAQRNPVAGRYLLAGLVVCARCGYAFSRADDSRKAKSTRLAVQDQIGKRPHPGQGCRGWRRADGTTPVPPRKLV